jgi:undecaprenyl-diphosphatase
MDTIYIFGAKYLYIVVLIIAIAYFLKQPKETKKTIAVFALIALPLAYITAKIAGHFYYDPRPFVQSHFNPLIFHEPDNGFPSDHALLTGAIATTWFYFNRRIGIVLWIIAILVGVSRVSVGVHHPIDIVGSFIIALTCVAVAHKIVRIEFFKKIFK